jgi:hypothetical protein
MTIKQYGGVFGRNPTFNDVSAEALGIGGGRTGTVAGVEITTKFCVKDEDNGVLAGLVHANNTTAASPAVLYACRSRGTLDAPTAVEDGDSLASIIVAGNDGTDLAIAARIDFEVDGTPGSNDMPGRIVFKTTPDGTQIPVDAMEIDSAQNVKLASGNLVIGTSGKGIDFSVTAGTGTSELFDDYEEGTWTPSVDGTTSGTAGGYLFNNALYTKVGRQVTVQASIVISAIGTLVGNFKITGLPFTSGGAFPSTYAAAVGFSNVPSAGAGYNMQARVGHASTTLDIFRETGGVSSACPVGATFEFDVVATYFV